MTNESTIEAARARLQAARAAPFTVRRGTTSEVVSVTYEDEKQERS